MKQKGVAAALQSGRMFSPKPDSIVTLRVTVYDADNTRHETVLRLESEELAKMGDVLMSDTEGSGG